MKTIVTHISPDLDAISSCWFIKKFLPGWKNAEITYVPAGTTFNGKSPYENPEIIHVDTGLGKFDHHQTNQRTCAAKKVFEFLLEHNHIKPKYKETLLRLIEFIIEDDNFLEVYYPESNSDRYEFLLNNIITGLKITLNDDAKVTELIFPMLDACFISLLNKVEAEKENKMAFLFQSYLGKSFALETTNDTVLKLAQKRGYKLVIRKDPKFGNFRIKTPPEEKLDLTPLYTKILEKDEEGSWFLHSSKHMLLNGSPKRPDQKPSPLSLKQMIEIVKNI